MSVRQENWQGMNWLRQDKRLAIYLRDGCACAWCGQAIENGAQLTLDHLTPHSKGGSNHESNLITACHRCNSSRGNRSIKAFAVAVASYLNHGIKPEAILQQIRTCRYRKLDRAAAKALIARRGSVAKVMAHHGR